MQDNGQPRHPNHNWQLYSEVVLLEDSKMGIKLNGVLIINIGYADYTILLTDNIHQLKRLINLIGEHNQAIGFNINTKK